MKWEIEAAQPDGIVEKTPQSVHMMLERGRVMPMARGHQVAAPAWPSLFSQPRPTAPGYRPGTMDSRNGTRHVPAPMGSGTSSVRTDAHEKLRAVVKIMGPNGTRGVIGTGPFIQCPGGVLSRVPLKHTPASVVLEAQRAVIGDGFRYGSPVTNFSRAAAQQMARGGVVPETGQIETRRHTTVGPSSRSVITPGGMPKTAGFTNVRNGVPTLPGTPFLSGVESLVAGTPPTGSGVPLAVGTEAFAVAAPYGGPYQAAPMPQPNAGGPPPSGLLLTAGDVKQANPSWQGGYYKPGAKASVQRTGAPTATATEAPASPRRALVVGALAVLAILYFGRK